MDNRQELTELLNDMLSMIMSAAPWKYATYKARVDKALASLQQAEPVATAEDAARWVDARRDAYTDEYGNYDPTTNTMEYTESGEQYVCELEEIAEGIRALSPSPQPAKVPEVCGRFALLNDLASALAALSMENDKDEIDDPHSNGYCNGFGKCLRIVRDRITASPEQPAKVPELERITNLLQAVGHVGVDFGCGEYQLGRDEIKEAQDLYAMLTAPQEGKDG